MSRLALDAILSKIAKSHNIELWFQPPDGVTLKYPCLLYSPTNPTNFKANNKPYVIFHNYEITYITKVADHEDIIKEIINAVPYGHLIREFKSDNLYHTVIGCSHTY